MKNLNGVNIFQTVLHRKIQDYKELWKEMQLMIHYYVSYLSQE